MSTKQTDIINRALPILPRFPARHCKLQTHGAVETSKLWYYFLSASRKRLEESKYWRNPSLQPILSIRYQMHQTWHKMDRLSRVVHFTYRYMINLMSNIDTGGDHNIENLFCVHEKCCLIHYILHINCTLIAGTACQFVMCSARKRALSGVLRCFMFHLW